MTDPLSLFDEFFVFAALKIVGVGVRVCMLHLAALPAADAALAPTDVAAVCRANGVYDEETIAHISSNCDNCLHTATYLIQQCMEQRIAA
jgi:hypothetical protein